jgi:ribosomal-protein-alanine N-acetyltransferase
MWEPTRLPGLPDVVEDPSAFAARCAARHRERQLGTGFGFGLFVDGRFAGEINVSNIARGPFQNCYIGYWIDELFAGKGLVPEGLVAVLQFCFEQLHLHRCQVSIVPRNDASLRVVEKLELRLEGLAERYLEINGVWEDHLRFAITAEEWEARAPDLLTTWLS